jgi:hypothetical protein
MQMDAALVASGALIRATVRGSDPDTIAAAAAARLREAVHA